MAKRHRPNPPKLPPTLALYFGDYYSRSSSNGKFVWERTHPSNPDAFATLTLDGWCRLSFWVQRYHSVISMANPTAEEIHLAMTTWLLTGHPLTPTMKDS